MQETFSASEVQALLGMSGRELGQHRRRKRLPGRTGRKWSLDEVIALGVWAEVNRLRSLQGNWSIRCFEMAEERAAALLASPDFWLFVFVLDAEHAADFRFPCNHKRFGARLRRVQRAEGGGDKLPWASSCLAFVSASIRRPNSRSGWRHRGDDG